MFLRHVLPALGLILIAAQPPTARGAICYAITSENLLIRFETATPGSVQTGGVISGLGIGETLLGIDLRPSGVLYLLTRNASSIGRIYTVNPNTAVATFQTATNQTLGGALHGISFDPVSGLLRVIGSDGSNVRIHPDTGVVTLDTSLIYTAGDPNAGMFPTIFAAAYTHSSLSGPAAALYTIDNGTDALVRVEPANNGQLFTVGPLGIDLGGGVAFDIAPSPLNHAYAAISTGLLETNLYLIDLETGHASLVGEIGPGLNLIGFTVGPTYQQTGFSRNQTIRINSSGTGYQVLNYNYTTGESAVTLYSDTTSNAPSFFPFTEWTGSFLYDYATARFTEAVYSRQHPL